MNKFIPTFWLTYWKKISSKSFIFSTIFMIIIFVGLSNADKIYDFFDKSEDDITVISSSDKALATAFKESYQKLDKKKKLKIVDFKKGEEGIKDETYKFLIDIKENEDKTIEAKVYSTEYASDSVMGAVRSTLTAFQSNNIAQSLNLSQDELSRVMSEAKVTDKVIKPKDANDNVSEQSKALNTAIVYAGLFLIFIITINYGSQIATEIAQEKSSRVIEMIITSISPITHLMAKILGVIAVAATQMIIYTIAIVICIYAFNLGETVSELGFTFGKENIRILIYAIIFLILGLLIYISSSAIVGSLTNRIEDIGQAIMPVTMLNMIAFYIAMFSLSNPDTLLVKVASYIPFFTPQIMLLRTISTKTSDFEIMMGIVICIITIILLFFIAAKIYKGSVFSTDKSMFKNFKRALKTK
ncbi:ABC transporter permease [Macrococcoides canis]|uniref:ABC transporter permease n=1 Tax=Macrococcoides canis TaxID=1855823 RepID=A0A4R6C3S9_9STAP|nr:ABC transporter permease [Macrococcus canis]TDM16136.1 ABC transporter permease [Macrococcus canis]TDM23127.1 ABC transporter permease [Macrococcus canis]TDM30941.1 ABC transporter permease [Macrococcus canis]TDM33846.1 ABC transporter permease [Macrococcus canis]TDM37360.1 ABC transporter permease [Macrococcus canis]